MSALRTILAWNTSRNTRATSRAVREQVTLAREQDLRARGWIHGAAPPWEQRGALHVLNEQAIARADIVNEANGARPSRYLIVGGIAAVGFMVVGLSTILVATVDDTPNWGGVAAWWLIVTLAVGVAYVLVHRSEQHRDEVLSHAVEEDGYCGWCGAPSPHLLEGVRTPPRVYHAAEIRDSV